MSNYPAVFCIWGTNEKDEANRFADMVQYLKQKNIIEDYNQIALLLKSVRLEHSEGYIQALRR
jgi:DNA helicase-2/ATP-dependent DNA helicase PcrA